MGNLNMQGIAMAKGFIHAIALPLFLMFSMPNALLGVAWIAIVAHLYAGVFKEKPAAYWFFGFTKAILVFYLIFTLLTTLNLLEFDVAFHGTDIFKSNMQNWRI